MAIEDSKIEKVVLVIHGVGDPPPGGTLNHFARSLARDEKPLVEHQSTIWLGERSVEPKHTKTFPAHVRQLDIDETHVEFAEVFWGDLSQVKRGTIGLIYGLFQILFGLRYVAYVAADQPGKAARLLKQLGLISSRVLQGPVLAVAIFLAMLTAAAFATDTIWPGSYRDASLDPSTVGRMCRFSRRRHSHRCATHSQSSHAPILVLAERCHGLVFVFIGAQNLFNRPLAS